MRIIICLLLVSCTTTATYSPDCGVDSVEVDAMALDASVQPTYKATWSGSLSTGPLDCSGAVDHPCPYQTYQTQLITDILPSNTMTDRTQTPVALTWFGHQDARGPVYEVAIINGAGSLILERASDLAGLREVATLPKTSTGWSGDVDWTLFNESGIAAFTLTLVRTN